MKITLPENYNKMGKRTNAALESFGAKRVYPYGEGDDDGTLDADFDQWKSELWPALIKSRQWSMSMSDG